MLRLLSTSLFAVFLLSPSASAQQDEPNIDGKSLAEWRKGLEDPNLAVRRTTIQSLTKLGPKAAPLAPDLVKLMKDKAPATRNAVAAALRAIGPEALPVVTEGLKGDDSQGRMLLLGVLLTYGDKIKPAAAAIAPLVKDINPSVRNQAIYALARCGNDGIKELKPLLSDKDQTVRLAAFGAMASSVPSAEMLDLAKAGLKDEFPAIRQQAVQLAARQAKDAVPVLITALGDENEGVRTASAMALSNLRKDAKEAVPALRKLLKDSSYNVRQYAMTALVGIGLDDETATELMNLLDDGNGNVNLTVFNTIGNLGKDALPHFEKALKSANVQTRRHIAYNLARLSSDVVPLIRMALKDSAPEVRKAAADGLGTLGEKAKVAIEDLTAALKDDDGSVRLAAAGALSRLANDPKASLSILLESLESSDSEVRTQATRSLAASAREVSPDLLKMLEDKDAAKRARAALGLAALGGAAENAIPALVKALADDDARVRRHVSQALGTLGNQVIKPLTEALKSQDERVRASAAQAVVHLQLSPGVTSPVRPVPIPVRPPPVVGADPLNDALTALLKDKSALVRVRAAHALVLRSPQQNSGYDVLLESIKDEDAAIRREAIAALNIPNIRFLRTPAAMKIREAVTAALEDKDQGVRLRAALASVPAYGYLYPYTAVGPANEKSVTILAEGLRKGDAEERSLSINALARLGAGAAPAAEALAEALADKDVSVRQNAAYTLMVIGPSAKAPVTALTERLNDRVLVIRQLAAQALTAIGPDAKDAVPALTKALDDSDPTLKLSAAQALGRIGPPSKPAVPGLLKLLKQPVVGAGPGVPFRQWGQPGFGYPRYIPVGSSSSIVLEALARIGPGASEAAPELVKMLEGSREQRRAAATVLGSLGGGAAPALLKGLESKDAEMRALCAEALGGLQDIPEDAVKALVSAMSDQDETVAQQAAFALGRLGSAAKTALPRLLAMLKNKDTDATRRGAAAQAIGEMGTDAKEAVGDLRLALKDTDAGVRKAAAQALGGIGPQAKDATAALSDLERDPDSQVRRAAAKAIKRITSEP